MTTWLPKISSSCIVVLYLFLQLTGKGMFVLDACISKIWFRKVLSVLRMLFTSDTISDSRLSKQTKFH